MHGALTAHAMRKFPRTAASSRPPDGKGAGRRRVFPDRAHEEIQRFDVRTHVNRRLGAPETPSGETALKTQGAPPFQNGKGRAANTRRGARKAHVGPKTFELWSASRRTVPVGRQHAGRWIGVALNGSLREPRWAQ